MKVETNDYRAMRLGLTLLINKVKELKTDRSLAASKEYNDLASIAFTLEHHMIKFICKNDSHVGAITIEDEISILADVSYAIEILDYPDKRKEYEADKRNRIAVGELPPEYPEHLEAPKLIYQQR